jgi:hypothetical protein
MRRAAKDQTRDGEKGREPDASFCLGLDAEERDSEKVCQQPIGGQAIRAIPGNDP